MTHPNIPYTIYVHENHILLVPREVETVHKEFPILRDERRFTLQLSDNTIDNYQQKYNKAPAFTTKNVCFGFEEDEGVVVAALLPGSGMIPYWGFRAMLAGNQTVIRKHFTDQSSSPADSFGLMQWDLAQAA
jgi:hypothetical protein